MEKKLAFGFELIGDQQVKNMAEPVPAYRIVMEGSALAAPLANKPLALPNKPSVAVLPFTNMSGDPEQEYFADGLVEDLTSSLSKIRGLFVIARNSSFAYKGQAVDIRKVAVELGVRYVLEGSVRKVANRVRITGQLVEGTNATHVWADKFEGAVEDIFDLQDRLTESIVGAIEPSIQRAEIDRARRKRPEKLTPTIFTSGLCRTPTRTHHQQRRCPAPPQRGATARPELRCRACLCGLVPSTALLS